MYGPKVSAQINFYFFSSEPNYTHTYISTYVCILANWDLHTNLLQVQNDNSCVRKYIRSYESSTTTRVRKFWYGTVGIHAIISYHAQTITVRYHEYRKGRNQCDESCVRTYSLESATVEYCTVL